MLTYKQRKEANNKTIDLLRRFLRNGTPSFIESQNIKDEIDRLRYQQLDYKSYSAKQRVAIIHQSTLIIESQMNYENRT